MRRSRWFRPAVLAAALLPVLTLAPDAAHAAPGNTKAFALISQTKGKGLVARWNPCGGAIDYRVNLTRAPKNSLAEVTEAVTRLSRSSGLTFRYAGTTTAVPMATKGSNGTYPTGTEIVIAWANPGKQSSLLPANSAATTAGMGGATWTSGYTASGAGAMKMIQGQVVLNANLTARMPRGFGANRGGTTGQLLMHELGHAVGLAHPDIADQHQIMYPMMTTKAATWGAGDLTGLAKVGKAAGCVYDRNPTAAATATGSSIYRN